MKCSISTVKYSIVCGMAAAALHRLLLSINILQLVMQLTSTLPSVVSLIIFVMLQLVPLFFLIGVQLEAYHQNREHLGLNVLLFFVSLFFMFSISPAVQLLNTAGYQYYKHWYENLPRVW